MRRLLAVAVALVQLVAAMPALVVPQPALATAGAPCVTSPGKDGAPGTLTGRYNTYYAPPYGTLAAGSTQVSLGTIDTTGGGVSTAVTAGDELLIIQMQDGTLNPSNSPSYGQTSVGNAGLYEYVYVTSVAGSVAAIVGAGSTGGLLNTYTEAAATSTSGQKTYQIIRVPQFTTATLSSNFVAAYWDGKTGGVAALDLNSTLNLGGASVYATGDGFRGAAVTVANTSPTSVLNNDYVDSAAMNGTNPPAQGGKGEGILGTPANLFYYTNFSTPNAPANPAVINSQNDGYPGGDQARGAPGNAGGGGTDADPAANDENTGGGGGGNGGAGGNGGFPWTPSYTTTTPITAQYSDLGLHTAANWSASNTNDLGGRGGVAQTASVTRVFMGGGGGAGANNNGSNNNASNAYGSSGGVGGGIIMLRLAGTTSNASFYANGTTGLAPANDGGGGGGAGGTIVITSPVVFSGITADVSGAAGTTANAAANGSGNQHGPGGGGGGGVVIATSGVTATATGGAPGTTTTGATTYGATAGASGTSNTSISPSDIPGVASGGECAPVAGSLTVGPVGGNAVSGSYDGVVPSTNLNDFTARAFFPSGAVIYNTGTTPGSWTGNTIANGPTTINVPNEFHYINPSNGQSKTVTIYGHVPSAPTGWTVQICPDNGANAPTTGCAPPATSAWGTPSVAGTTASETYTVPKKGDTGSVKFWAVYSAPAGVVGYTRYDATIVASDGGGNQNETHNELYAGFVVLTKSQAVVSTGCTMQTPPPSGLCPGAVMLYEIDYRNIVAGGLSEATNTGALISTGPGSLIITENGNATNLFNTTNGASGQANQWGTDSNGLLYALAGGVTCPTLTASYTGTAMGDSTAGSVFTGGTTGSTSFTDQVGGGSFQLVPQGVTGTWQGTVCFEVTMK